MADDLLGDRPASQVAYIGPVEHNEVVVGGYRVPGLNAHPMNGGMILFTYDGRFALELAVDVAEQAVPFIADCIAVALGYTCHPRTEYGEPRLRTPFPHVQTILTTEEEG